MEHFKQFFKQKGLYLACLAVAFAATAAGVLALRSILDHVAELANTAQEEAPWQDDTTVNKPDTTQPEPARTPAPASAGGSPGFWRGKVLAPYSGDELVYNATLGDWRTHNGVDVAAAAGEAVPAVRAGRVTLVDADALWGGVVEVSDAGGRVWRYCGVDGSCVVGDAVAAGDVLGTAGAIPAEADLDGHVHLECLEGDGSSWVEPGIQ